MSRRQKFALTWLAVIAVFVAIVIAFALAPLWFVRGLMVLAVMAVAASIASSIRIGDRDQIGERDG